MIFKCWSLSICFYVIVEKAGYAGGWFPTPLPSQHPTILMYLLLGAEKQKGKNVQTLGIWYLIAATVWMFKRERRINNNTSLHVLNSKCKIIYLPNSKAILARSVLISKGFQEKTNII